MSRFQDGNIRGAGRDEGGRPPPGQLPFQDGRFIRAAQLNEMFEEVRFLRGEVTELRTLINRSLQKQPSLPVFSPTTIALISDSSGPIARQPTYRCRVFLRDERGKKTEIDDAGYSVSVLEGDCVEQVSGGLRPMHPGQATVTITYGGEDHQSTVAVREFHHENFDFTCLRCDHGRYVESSVSGGVLMSSVYNRTHRHRIFGSENVPSGPVAVPDSVIPTPDADGSCTLVLLLRCEENETLARVRVCGQATSEAPIAEDEILVLCARESLAGDNVFQEAVVAWHGPARRIEVEGALVLAAGTRTRP